MAVLERIDAVLGRIVEAAMRAGGGRAMVAVVSDHGFLPVTHEVHLNALLAAEGLLTVADTATAPSDWRARGVERRRERGDRAARLGRRGDARSGGRAARAPGRRLGERRRAGARRGGAGRARRLSGGRRSSSSWRAAT
jgi:predicted AlkP superfamily phosphohydrolase/phosphomutase